MSELTEPVLVSSIFMLIGLILYHQMSLRGWFKKESWKIQLFNIKKKNELTLKKMARDLEVSYSSPQKLTSQPQGGGLAEKFLPSIMKNLSPEQTAAIAEKFIGGTDEAEEGDIADIVLNYAMQNPEMAKKFVDNLGQGGGGGGDYEG